MVARGSVDKARSASITSVGSDPGAKRYRYSMHPPSNVSQRDPVYGSRLVGCWKTRMPTSSGPGGTSTPEETSHEDESSTSTAWKPARSWLSHNVVPVSSMTMPPNPQPIGYSAMHGSRVADGTDCASSTITESPDCAQSGSPPRSSVQLEAPSAMAAATQSAAGLMRTPPSSTRSASPRRAPRSAQRT